MAAAAKTPNLNLPQWVATEKPERTDFNAALSAIDGAIIVESGSNANGSYIKFADGTMICSGMAIGSITFPIGFYVSPNIAITPFTSAIVVVTYHNITSTGLLLSIHYWTGTNFDNAGDYVSWVAIGRWKA